MSIEAPHRLLLGSGPSPVPDRVLALGDGVEARRDPEEVDGRSLVVHPVGDRAQRLSRELLERRERRELVLPKRHVVPVLRCVAGS